MMNLEPIKHLLAVAILADGQPGKEELSLLADIESDMELPGLAKAVTDVLPSLEAMDDDQLTATVRTHGGAIDADDKPLVFEAIVSVMLSDGVLYEEEIANILAMAEALEIPDEKAVARLLFQVQEMEGELIVDVEDQLEEFIVQGGRTRYTSWDAWVRALNTASYPAALIERLRELHDHAKDMYKHQLVVNFTPNFMTLGCAKPASRSRTFCYARLKKDVIQLEFAGKVAKLAAPSDLTQGVKDDLLNYFNTISAVKV
ncbi:MAG: hypothetical protein ACK46G_02565 [Flavobacteriales bacterium]|jgi:hypothetical protein